MTSIIGGFGKEPSHVNQEKTETRYGLTSDTIFYGIIPRDHYLECVVIENITANQAQLSLGTSAGISNVFISEAIEASGATSIYINRLFSISSDTTLYLHDEEGEDTWNSTTLNITFVSRKINR